MARRKRSLNIVSPELLSAVKSACRDLLPHTTDHTSCVSAAKVAKHKDVASAFTVSSPAALRPFVLAAVAQMHGFEARRGGGIHRVKTTRKRGPKAAPQPDAQAATQEVPDLNEATA